MYKDYTNIREIDGQWIATVYEYAGNKATGHPVKSYTEAVSAPVPDLPESKKFDTGYVHLQFDISTAEYKNFCADPRVSEFLNNQTVEMSALGIDFRKGLITVLENESVISSATAALIQALLDTWKSQVAA